MLEEKCSLNVCSKVMLHPPPPPLLSHPLLICLIASVVLTRGGLWETACFYCARDAAHQFGSCHPAAQSIRHRQRAAVQLLICEWLTLHPQDGYDDVFSHLERNCTFHLYRQDGLYRNHQTHASRILNKYTSALTYVFCFLKGNLLNLRCINFFFKYDFAASSSSDHGPGSGVALCSGR